MKKTLCILLCTAMILSLCACTAAPAEQTPASTPVSTPEPTPSPTPKPTPTPEPTLSPEEIEAAKNMEEYDKYKMYYQTYGDEYALLFIKDMLDEGKITPDMLDGLNGSFGTFSDDMTWHFFRKTYEEQLNIINGKLEKMYPEALATVFNTYLHDDSLLGIVHITLLDTEEKRERFINGIEIINAFYESPTDENRIKMEDVFFAEDLTPGEIRMLFSWIWSSSNRIKKVVMDGKEYDIIDYPYLKLERFGKSIKDRDVEAYETLIKMNNTPNSKKEWLTESEDS